MVKDKDWLKEAVQSNKSMVPGYKDYISIINVTGLIDQLDEPALPVIPQFVADYFEEAKEGNYSLNQLFGFVDDKENKELWDWLYPTAHEGKRENQETFARAWLDGYEVEKEPRWVVKKDGESFVKFAEDFSDYTNEILGCYTFDGKVTGIIKKFTNRAKAEAVALLVGGEVEEVE